MIPRVYQVVTARGLNLRAGPGADYPSRAVLTQGAAVEVMEFDGAWLAVRTASGPGWVAGRYTSHHAAPWLAVAREEERRGVREIPGPAHEARILEYHSATLLRATSDEVAWCSSFACWCMEQVGVRSTRSAAARSWLTWGRAAATPVEGCVTVFSRGADPASGHVALFLAREGDRVRVLGGNQGNRVCETTYPAAQLLGYRLPH